MDGDDYMDDDYQYEEPEDLDEQQEDVEAGIEISYFNAEQLLRQKNYQQALQEFNKIYETADQNSLRNWKSKTLTQILELYIQLKQYSNAKATLNRITELYSKDKPTEGAIKSMIMILQKLEPSQYYQCSAILLQFIDETSDMGKIKIYMLMLEKQLAQGNKKEAIKIYNQFKQTSFNIKDAPVGLQLEIYCMKIKYYRIVGSDLKDLLREVQLKLAYLEQENCFNDAHLSELKQELAAVHYEQCSYKTCANFLCSSFVLNIKFNTNSDKLKQSFKLNTLMLFLCGNAEILDNEEYNPLLQEATAPYKAQSDIQALFGLIEAYKDLDIRRFKQLLKVVDLELKKSSAYSDICERVIRQINKQKVLFICSPYSKVTFEYLSQRIGENSEYICDILEDLVVSKQLHGAINLERKYFEILQPLSQYYSTQLQNLKQIREMIK